MKLEHALEAERLLTSALAELDQSELEFLAGRASHVLEDLRAQIAEMKREAGD